MQMEHFYKVVTLVAILSLTGCMSGSEEDTSAVGDVYIFSKTLDGKTRYGVEMHAYSYSNFATVSVSTDYGTIYSLSPNQGYYTDMYYRTPDSELLEDLPDVGYYYFSSVFASGKTNTFSDALYEDFLNPPVLSSITQSSGTINLAWESNSADLYLVQIIDSGNNLVYSSSTLTSTSYSIVPASSGWLSSSAPVSGESYTIIVYSYLFETSTYSESDIQAVSSLEVPVVWES
jgi:hypothetical protein